MNWKTYRRVRKGLLFLVLSFVFLSVCVRIVEHTDLARHVIRNSKQLSPNLKSQQTKHYVEADNNINYDKGVNLTTNNDLHLRNVSPKNKHTIVVSTVRQHATVERNRTATNTRNTTATNTNDVTTKKDDNSKIKENVDKHNIETNEQFMNRMKIRMDERRKYTKEMCDKLGIKKNNVTYEPWHLSLPTPRPWFLKSDKYPLIYCEIPKSGSTNWKRVMMVMNGLANSTSSIKQGKAHAVNIGWVNTNPNTTQRQKYLKSLKMMIVRDPFERLTSAYLDKVAYKKSINASVFGRFSYEVATTYGKSNESFTPENGIHRVTACSFEVRVLKCKKPNHVIKVHDAMFGRQDDSTCMQNYEGKEAVNMRPCSSKNALLIASQLCDGKQKCEVVGSPVVFGHLQGCGNVPKYLQIDYHCVDRSVEKNVTVCDRKRKTVKCPVGSEIRVMSAFFGRLETTTCRKRARIANVHCDAETATAAAMVACHKKNFCVLEASKTWIQSDPCPSTDKYLTMWYHCEPSTTQETSEEVSNSISSPPTILKMPKNIFKKYPKHATFNEFVSYLTDPGNAVVTKDKIDHGSDSLRSTNVRHWQNFHTLCYPCHIQYDVIAHIETIEEDARYVLNMIGAPKNLKYPEGYNTAGHSSTNSSIVHDAFAKLEPRQIEKLIELYKIDYQLFQYNFPRSNKQNLDSVINMRT